jgi:hypothetical protein
MGNHWFKGVVLAAVFMQMPAAAHGWGQWGHARINRTAVFTLPSPLLAFYKKHIGYITDHASHADRRRYAVPGEAARHYIDLDAYGTYPFTALPRRWVEATELFGADSLQRHGILPWHLYLQYVQLTEAFYKKDAAAILRLSADMGHYLADAHVPLHTTRNYNGQLTGQHGIHGLWESRIPELLGAQFNLFVGRAQVIEKPQEEFWRIVLQSHACVDTLLRREAALSQALPPDAKYGYETRGNQTVRVYTQQFVQRYHDALNGMVERRLRQAIVQLGSIWLTAWVNAGQPDLTTLDFDDNTMPQEDLSPRLQLQDREASLNGSAFGKWLAAPCTGRYIVLRRTRRARHEGYA